MICRDEQDILPQTLAHLLSWLDTLFILDTGSTDGSREIVADFAARDKRVTVWNHEPVVFTDMIRSVLFNRYRDRFEDGDWVGRVDADEFYHVPPPRFVKERVQPGETALFLQWYFFRLTRSEVNRYESREIDIIQERKLPIQDRRRFYKISDYSEPRFFRYRPSVRWPHTVSFPFNAGYLARERLPIRHYPNRDPLQMEARYRLRADMKRRNLDAPGHWLLRDWHKDVLNDDGSEQTDGEGLSENNAVVHGQLHYWKPGTELEECHLYNHLPSPGRRLVQRMIHPLLLPIIDRLRPRYDPAFQLTPAP